jgi:flagellar motor switch protein FliG
LMPIKKVAIFLMLLGVEKGQSVIALMDNSEIKAVVPEIQRMTAFSQEIQEAVWAEFKELGYEDKMRPPEVLTVIRFLFNGSKISAKGGR